MKREKHIEEIQKKIIPVLKRHGVRHAGLFGSAVRDEMKKTSDVDILVELQPDKSLLDLVALKLDLEEALGKKVDVVEYSTIHPFLEKKILKEEVAVL